MTEQPGTATAERWTALLDLSPEERIKSMVDAYSAMAEMAPEQRRGELREVVAAVYRLRDDDLRTMTESRLRAWLRMERDSVRPVAEDFEAVLDDMPADLAMRRVTVVQLVSMHLSPDERRELREIVPRVLGNEPPPMESTQADDGGGESERRPWWAFWRKS